ncbi:MAG: EAL domain-containing protein [Acidimicrobiales bacterium]
MRSTFVLAATAVFGVAMSLIFAPLWIPAAAGVGLVVGAALAIQDRASRRATPVDSTDVARRNLDSFSTDVVLLYAPDGSLQHTSPSVTNVLGWSVVEFNAMRLHELVHSDDVRAVISCYRDVASKPGMSRECEARLRTKTAWQWMGIRVTNANLVPDIGGVVVNLRDITGRQLVENSLVQREEQLSVLATVSAQALAGSDEATLISAAVDAVRVRMACDGCEIHRTSTTAAELIAGVGPGGIPLDRPSATPAGSKLAIAAAAGNTPAYEVGDHIVTGPKPPPLATAVAVPIGGPAGTADALIARSGSPRAFHDADVEFLTGVAGIVALARRQRGAEQDAFHRSRHDDLTGLVNRDVFLERLAKAVAHSDPEHDMVAVLLLDVDHFKIINDSLGHAAGDALLEALGERFRQALRPGDTLARFGGDEFVMLTRGLATADQAVLAAERLQSVLVRPVAVAGHDVQVTASVGVVVCDSAAADTGDLMRAADAALHRAKERGRERVEMFEPSMVDAALVRLRTEEELRAALARDQLRVLYQPIVDLSSGKTDRVEALVRWVHPTRGLVSPDEFIPISEATGLIEEIGAWVIDAAAKQARAWVDEGFPTRVSVNISARQLSDGSLLRSIDAAIREHRIDASLLAVEVTESGVMSHAGTTRDTLRQINDRGISIAIDDFGTGHSSIAYLETLPIDIIKIDGSFVARVHKSGADYATVSALIQLAKVLGSQVVAEGVETEEQLELLRDLGCDLAQGFLFSPAVFDIAHGEQEHALTRLVAREPRG